MAIPKVCCGTERDADETLCDSCGRFICSQCAASYDVDSDSGEGEDHVYVRAICEECSLPESPLP